MWLHEDDLRRWEQLTIGSRENTDRLRGLERDVLIAADALHRRAQWLIAVLFAVADRAHAVRVARVALADVRRSAGYRAHERRPRAREEERDEQHADDERKQTPSHA